MTNQERRQSLDLSVIIVSYNTRDLTLQCIDSVIRETSTITYEIIVIDNASADGSAQVIRDKYPNVELIACKDNVGFARANNLAANKLKGRRILLLNPDTLILNGAIDNLTHFADENPECRIWGGRTLFSDGTLNFHSCWGRITLWSTFCAVTGLTKIKSSRLFNPEEYGRWPRDSARAVDIVSGCFFLVDVDLWKQLGGFDPAFFMYAEEADFCLRARQVGASPKITPEATIIHYGGASERNKTDQRIKLLAGKITLIQRHWSPAAYRVGRLLYLAFPLTRYRAYSTLSYITRGSHFNALAQSWLEVWRARDRWANGWQFDADGATGTSSPHAVSAAAPRSIRVRETTELDFVAVSKLLGKGIGFSETYFSQLFQRLRSHATPDGFPKYGRVLESDGSIVGAIILIFSKIPNANRASTIRCHVTGWCVEPPYRCYASLFFAKDLKHGNVTYMNTSALEDTRPIIELQGFRRYANGQFVICTALEALSGPRAETFDFCQVAGEPIDRERLSKHAQWGCISFWCLHNGTAYPFVFRPRPFKGIIPGAQLIYCRDPNDVIRFAGSISRHLLSRGMLFASIDSNGPMDGLIGRYRNNVDCRYYKGPKPRLGDLTYTHLAMCPYETRRRTLAIAFNQVSRRLIKFVKP